MDKQEEKKNVSEQMHKLPLLCEKNLVRELTQQLGNPKVSWQNKGLQALTQFTWGLSVCSLRTAPPSLRPYKFDGEEKDEDLISFALDDRVFDFLYRTVLPHSAFCKEEFYQRRIHTLLTDFIVLMPLKVKELKNEADMVARVSMVFKAFF
jgi:nuclear pore complex protein Nup205